MTKTRKDKVVQAACNDFFWELENLSSEEIYHINLETFEKPVLKAVKEAQIKYRTSFDEKEIIELIKLRLPPMVLEDWLILLKYEEDETEKKTLEKYNNCKNEVLTLGK